MKEEQEIKETKKKVTPKKEVLKKSVVKTKPKKETVEPIEKVEINPILKEETPEVIEVEKKKFKFTFVNTSHEFKTAEVTFLVLIAVIIGVCIGSLTIGLNTKPDKVLNTITATADPTFNKLIKTYNDILERYIDDVNETQLIDGAIDGMLNTVGDPYTSYFNEKETTTFYKKLKGTFFGIGCELIDDGTNVYIVNVLKDSPAQKAGLKSEDIIKKVNNTSAVGITSAAVVSIIEKSVSNDIDIVVSRNDIEKTFKVTKANVTIESVHTSMYTENSKKIGYIKIDLFAQNTNKQFEKELKALEKKGIDSLIIDVRNNSGGYLNVVGDIISMFFAKDQTIYQMKSKEVITKRYSTTDEKRTYPIAVLQNANSASGSEILAGAIKDMYKGQIIGTNSYGKSSVQQTSDLGDGTMIKYTVQKWLTAGGTDVGGMGLEPTVKVEQTEIYFNEPTIKNDAQFQKALSILSN